MSHIIINLAQEHINKGIKGNVKLCPIALAIKDAVTLAVEVGANTANIGNDTYLLPSHIRKFIHRFDTKQRQSIYPQKFEIIKLESTVNL